MLCMIIIFISTINVNVEAAEPSINDLAAQAVKNNYRLYQEGRAVDAAYGNFGAYDAYILTQAGADLSTWERDGTNLKTEVIALIDDTIATPDGKSSKRIAQEYLVAKAWGENEKATALLNILKDRQTASGNGSFDNNGFSDLPAFEALGRAGDIDQINTADAITYILSIQDGSTGAWTSSWNDFVSTAEAVRALKYLKPFADVDTQTTVQAAIDAGLAWMQGMQQADGSLKNGDFDDPAIDTSEAIYTLNLLGIDPNTWVSGEGKTPVDYMEDNALNSEDNTFGSSKNLADNTWVLDAYIKLGASVPGDTVLGITVTPESATIEREETQQYTATVYEFVYGESDISVSASWSTGNEDIATVNGSGLVTGVAAGETNITASYQGCSGVANIVVESGDSGLGSLPERAKLYIEGYDGVIIPWTWIDIEEGETVLSLTLRVLDDRDIPYEVSGGYISSIDGQSEFDKGSKSGWLYRVNKNFESHASDPAGTVPVNDGDYVEWRYTADFGEDIGWVDSSSDFDGKEDIESQGIDKVIENANEVLSDKNASVEDIEEAIDNLIAAFGEDMEDDQNYEVNDKIVELAQKAIEKAGSVKIDASQIQEDKQKAIANLEKDKLLFAADKALKKAKELEKKMYESNVDTYKILEKKVSIEVPTSGKEEVDVNIPAGVLGDIFEKEIDKLEIKTEVAAFGITSDIFDEQIKERKIKLTAKKVDNAQLPDNAKNNVPEDSVVVDLDLSVANEKVSKFSKPIEISIPYNGSAEDGDKITVFLLKDDGTIEAVGGLYDPATNWIKFITNHFSKYFAKPSIKEFDDMTSYIWAKEAISIMAGKGFIKGRNGEVFDPGANITRAEFAAIVVRMLKYESLDREVIPFKDVKKDDWYYGVISAAYQNNLINGKSNEIFDPNGNITRQEIAKIIANVLNVKAYKQVDKDELEMFIDKGDIANWAENAVALTAKLGIVKGMENATFAPAENANRAQAAVMLYRLYKVLMS